MNSCCVLLAHAFAFFSPLFIYTILYLRTLHPKYFSPSSPLSRCTSPTVKPTSKYSRNTPNPIKFPSRAEPPSETGASFAQFLWDLPPRPPTSRGNCRHTLKAAPQWLCESRKTLRKNPLSSSLSSLSFFKAESKLFDDV